MIYPEYIATEDGRIYSKRRNKYLSVRLNKTGYLICNLCVGHKCKTVQVHRYVAESFIPNPNNLPLINHKNGIKTDNRVTNLEWVTAQENILHALRTGLTHPARGKQTLNGHFDEDEIREIRRLYATKRYSQRDLAKRYNVSKGTIQFIVERKTYYYIN